tara:strand:+ start:3532 stop:4470 length:939 start_codon:yes stop_codon:yes gene_type:complete
MWKEIFAIVFTLALVVFAVGFFYGRMPGEPVDLIEVLGDGEGIDVSIAYGETPVFAENMRFNHNLISFYIEPDCSEDRNQKMKEAFAIFHEEMNIISFYETQKGNADILVGCSREYVDTDNGMFIAGEGGPSQYLNGTLFNPILEGKITLYQKSECSSYPVVELHELLHVFGFNHINNQNSLMYNVSNCDQRITSDMIDTINSLYSIEPLPDIFIDSVSTTKRRYYIDFNISIKNKGLVDAGEVKLIVSTESDEIKEFELEDVSIFTTRTLVVQNLKLPSRSDKEITFNVSLKDNGEEIDLANNVVVMIVED